MTEIRTERGDLVPEKYVPPYNGPGYAICQLVEDGCPECGFEVCGGYSLDTLISDLAHAEAKYAAAEQAWQKDAADKNNLVEMLTTRVRELEALLSRLAEDNAALRAQVERMKAPVTDEELRAICDPIYGFVPPEDIDRLLRARAAKEQP